MSETTYRIGGRDFHLLFPELARPLTGEEWDDLLESIEEHGIQCPIVVDEADGVIDGGHRLRAAHELGLEMVPFIIHAGLDDDQKYRLALTLNFDRRHLADRQSQRRDRIQRVIEARQKGDSLRTIAEREGVSHPQIIKDLREAGGNQLPPEPKATGRDGKTYPARRDPAKAKERAEKRQREKLKELEEAKPNLDLPEWRLLEGDCLELLPTVSSGSARLVFCDPPYNIGVDYGDGDQADLLDDEQYCDWFGRWIAEAHRILTDDGSFWVLIGDEYAGEYAVALKRAGFVLRNWIKWYETFGVNCERKFNRTSRHLFYAVKSEKAFVFNRDAVSRPSDRQAKYSDPRANPEGKVLDDVWTDIPRLAGTHGERIPTFPTQLPVALLRRIVLCATEPGDLVMDFFNGSGTTGVATLANHRRYLGIERQPHFAALARKRLGCVQLELPE